jgi:hypothetical protein
VDQGLAADKGSQLLFIADTGVNMRSYMMESGSMVGMDGMEMEGMSVSATTGMMMAMNQNFISITNTGASGNPSKKSERADDSRGAGRYGADSVLQRRDGTRSLLLESPTRQRNGSR